MFFPFDKFKFLGLLIKCFTQQILINIALEFN